MDDLNIDIMFYLNDKRYGIQATRQEATLEQAEQTLRMLFQVIKRTVEDSTKPTPDKDE